ncbi:cyclin-T1 [Acrasis kona]|uniref:Cyclin-T1 n=1 Tax=Acrasis kona TaxID=1008807 RepID=A0AAW2ZQ07_9EUKA
MIRRLASSLKRAVLGRKKKVQVEASPSAEQDDEKKEIMMERRRKSKAIRFSTSFSIETDKQKHSFVHTVLGDESIQNIIVKYDHEGALPIWRCIQTYREKKDSKQRIEAVSNIVKLCSSVKYKPFLKDVTSLQDQSLNELENEIEKTLSDIMYLFVPTEKMELSYYIRKNQNNTSDTNKTVFSSSMVLDVTTNRRRTFT